ncbi:MAG: DNA-methyltransferase [Nitrospiria bacterium]
MGDLEHEHARQTELILFYAGQEHSWPDKRPTDVVQAPRTGNVEHPTEKPVYLMEQIVKWTAGVVFDPFMGSGTTGVACMNLGRKFIGIEIEPKYFDIACERISQAQKQLRMFP